MADHAVREVTLTGGLPCLVFGTGRPLVYLGGFTYTHTVPAGGIERAVVRRIVRPYVDAGYAVYWTNRQPGMPEDTTMKDIADTHAVALDAEFGCPVPVLGHSTGGSIALQLGVDHPEAVSRLVLASTAYALGPVAKRDQRQMLEHARRGRAAMRYGADGFTRNPVLQRLMFALLWVVDHVQGVPDDPSDMIAMLVAEDGFDVRDRLGEVTAPTLVIHGARDYFWTERMFAETAERIPRGKLVRYPRYGHGVVTKKPFYRDVLAFLADA